MGMNQKEKDSFLGGSFRKTDQLGARKFSLARTIWSWHAALSR